MGKRFIWAMILQGPLFAALQFGEVVARKSFQASALSITVLTMTMPIVSLSALWWGQILKGRDQRKALFVSGLLGSVAIMSCYWTQGVGHLIVAYALSYLAYAVLLTGQNRVLQQHVDKKNRGGIFGLSNSFRMALAAVVSLIAGWWMDTHVEGYRHLFLFGGFIGFISILLFSSIPTSNKDPLIEKTKINFIDPLVNSWKLIKRRPDLLRFEIGFMIYGVAFMMTLPVVPIFLVDDLQLDYTTIGFARGAIQQLLMIPALFIFGRIFDKITPHLLAGRVFLLLTLYPLFLVLATVLPIEIRIFSVYAAFAALGVAMGGVSIVWHTGSVRFAAEEDAGEYQAVHVAATGVRGSFAPLLAYVAMNYIGKPMTLLITMVLWFVSALFMFSCHKKDGLPLMDK